MSNQIDRLLIIDDEPLICDFVSTVARQIGLAVTATSSADEFKAAYLAELPSIVILDLQMPQLDGVEILRFLASNDCDAAIMLISGMAMKTLATASNIGRSKGLNMRGVLQKPFGVDSLRTALLSAVKENQTISEDSLRKAISNGQLVVQYQPIASRDSSGGWTIDGAEALVRWQHPEYGIIPPQRFIGLAEDTDLIMPLTDYVLRESIEQHAMWRMAGLDISVSINMSPVLLNNVTFPDYLDKLFADYGVDSGDFTFELTEGATNRDIELTMDVLTRLRLKGVGLSIDDFGTGYSSLKQLFLLPFNELKLDLSFVSQIHKNVDAKKMVKVMIYLAHELEMTSCAEGVENIETMNDLEELGCDKIQGFLISPAVSGKRFEEITKNWNSHAEFPHQARL